MRCNESGKDICFVNCRADFKFEDPIHFVCASLVRINQIIRFLRCIRKQIRDCLKPLPRKVSCEYI